MNRVIIPIGVTREVSGLPTVCIEDIGWTMAYVFSYYTPDSFQKMFFPDMMGNARSLMIWVAIKRMVMEIEEPEA